MTDCMPWQRARREDQIEQREATILEAAALLFDQHRYEAISLVMIGKQAKFTRSNLYRYFKTKEDIYLRLLEQEVEHWYQQAFIDIQSASKGNFVECWLGPILNQPRLLKLFDILDNVLEENASDEAILAFKQTTAKCMVSLQTELISKQLFEDEEGVGKFFMASISLATGIYPKLNMPERIHKLSEQVGMSMPPEYYKTILQQSMLALYQTFSSKK